MNEETRLTKIVEEEKKKLRQSAIERAKSLNLNNMSYWLYKMEQAGFNIPRTVIIKLPDDKLNWLMSDNYKPEAIREFNNWVISNMPGWAITMNEIFIKTGTFSGKFNFEDCHVKKTINIGEQFLSIFYAGMCVGAGTNDELVIREYLPPAENNKLPTVYNGLPLRAEIRIFYDFDNHEILDWFDYWDKEYLKEHKRGMSEEDYKNFMEASDTLELMNGKLFRMVKNESDKFEKVEGLEGVWSVDFLMKDNTAVMIDMAVGSRSAYREWVGKNGRLSK